MKQFTNFTPGQIVTIYTKPTRFRSFASSIIQAFGYTLSIMSSAALVLTAWPMIGNELSYRLEKDTVKTVATVESSSFDDLVVFDQEKIIYPASLEFGVVIPKIQVNSPVFANIDAADKSQYLEILKKGLAHAKGTYLPGQGGSVYIFGHSTDYVWNVSQINAQFYLLKELVEGDEVNVFFNNKRFRYKVTKKYVVGASDVSIMQPQRDKEILILQTCTPPGTTWKRLIVEAEPVSSFQL